MTKIGAVSLGWSGTSLKEVFKQLTEMGGECIEINSRTQRHHQIELTPDTVANIQGWAKDYDLTLGSLSGYSDFTYDDPQRHQTEIDNLADVCRLANALEIPIVRAFTGDTRDGITAEGVRSQVISALKTMAEHARRFGVIIALENHGRLFNDGPLLAGLLDEVNSDHIKITLDTGNFSWAGHNLDQTWADFHALLPYTANVHIKDGIWQDERFEFVAAGAGSLQIAKLIGELKTSGYQGNIYSEYEGKGDFIANTRLSIAFLKETIRD